MINGRTLCLALALTSLEPFADAATCGNLGVIGGSYAFSIQAGGVTEVNVQKNTLVPYQFTMAGIWTFTPTYTVAPGTGIQGQGGLRTTNGA
jgi:hypothetical protein